MITDVELGYYRWKELVAKERRNVVEMRVEEFGNKQAAEILNCSEATIRKILKASCVADLKGAPIFESFDNGSIAKLSLDEHTLAIENGLFKAVRSLSSFRDLERYLDVSARTLSRIRDRQED